MPAAVHPAPARALGRILASLLLAAGALAGCATIDNQGVKVAPIEAPAAPKVITETTASAEHKRMVALFGGEYRDPALERYLDGILAKFAGTDELAGKTYKVTILNTPIVNAFALPSGDIFVTRGLLALANDSSEVAAVIAHEMGHVIANHGILRQEKEAETAIAGRVASEVLHNESASREEELRGKLRLAQFSRNQELQADAIGIN